MSEMGGSQKRTSAGGRRKSALPQQQTIHPGEVRFVPIVLKKSFWDDDQNFQGPLMRFARGDMRDHIVSHKNDHGPS